MKGYVGSLLLVLIAAPFAWGDTRDTVVFRGRMTPAQENPPIAIEASATYTFTVRVTARNLRGAVTGATASFEVDYTMPSATTFSGLHIHNGPAGVNAGVVIDSGITGTNPVVGGATGRISGTSRSRPTGWSTSRGSSTAPNCTTSTFTRPRTRAESSGDQLEASKISFRPALLTANEVPPITDSTPRAPR